ncbi:MAG: hypothetical protein ACRDI2_14970, partial [Chloroflexota bacterium]
MAPGPGWHLDQAGLQAAIGNVDDALAALLHARQDTPDTQAAGLSRSLLRVWPALWTFAEVSG